MSECNNCNDFGWVCENHSDQPWDGSGNHPCCRGAGVPCPDCNSVEGVYPRMLPGAKIMCCIDEIAATLQDEDWLQ